MQITWMIRLSLKFQTQTTKPKKQDHNHYLQRHPIGSK